MFKALNLKKSFKLQRWHSS